MMTNQREELVLELLDSLRFLYESGCGKFQILGGYRPFDDSNLLELIANGGAIFADIDCHQGLMLYNKAHYFMKLVNRGLFTPREAATRLIDSLSEADRCRNSDSKSNRRDLKELINGVALTICAQLENGPTETADVQAAADLVCAIARYAYPNCDIELAASKYISLRVALKMLQREFQLIYRSRRDLYKIYFLSIPQAETMSVILSESKQRQNNGVVATEDWINSVWDRTRLIDTPIRGWFRELPSLNLYGHCNPVKSRIESPLGIGN